MGDAYAEIENNGRFNKTVNLVSGDYVVNGSWGVVDPILITPNMVNDQSDYLIDIGSEFMD
jgi:hypothetical protein